MTYQDKPWHRECFLCIGCRKQLSGQRFTSRENYPYCLECFSNLYAKKCVGCTKPITSESPRLCAHVFIHLDTAHAFLLLIMPSFTFVEERSDKQGEALALTCALCKHLCLMCAGLAGAKYISFEERQWHSECFTCVQCAVSLVGRGFLTQRDNILCTDCGREK